MKPANTTTGATSGKLSGRSAKPTLTTMRTTTPPLPLFYVCSRQLTPFVTQWKHQLPRQLTRWRIQWRYYRSSARRSPRSTTRRHSPPAARTAIPHATTKPDAAKPNARAEAPTNTVVRGASHPTSGRRCPTTATIPASTVASTVAWPSTKPKKKNVIGTRSCTFFARSACARRWR